MERKPDTQRRTARRRYEEKHKEERKATNGTFSTSIPRQELEEIVSFLKKYGVTKVDLIREGYRVLLNQTKTK